MIKNMVNVSLKASEVYLITMNVNAVLDKRTDYWKKDMLSMLKKFKKLRVSIATKKYIQQTITKLEK